MISNLDNWLSNYPQACLDFNAMPADMKVNILHRIRAKYPEGHSNYKAITAQIAEIERKAHDNA